jgi:hypothetical protein
MCCSFNLEAADDIFQAETYTRVLQKMQSYDKNNSFVNSSVPAKYLANNEPRTLPGRNKGLVLMLDAHSDLFAAGSNDANFNGFVGLISASGNLELPQHFKSKNLHYSRFKGKLYRYRPHIYLIISSHFDRWSVYHFRQLSSDHPRRF